MIFLVRYKDQVLQAAYEEAYEWLFWGLPYERWKTELPEEDKQLVWQQACKDLGKE